MTQGPAKPRAKAAGVPFPRPVRGFAGRVAELSRVSEQIDHEALFLVVGLGGIGKTEFVYRAIEQIRTREPWRHVQAVLADVRPGATVMRTLAQLLAAVGAPEPRHGQSTELAHSNEQLATLAEALDAGPCILFIDNIHHLPRGSVAEGLGFLARRLERGRVFVASREDMPLPLDAPAPVVTRLGPLDPAAAVELSTALAERLQKQRPDPEALLRATHGSPFHIRQMLVRRASEPDPLASSWRGLSPFARAVLLAASVAEPHLPVEILQRVWHEPEPLGAALAELEQRLVIDVEQGRLVVHDLIRESLVQHASPDEVATAHGQAARLCLHRASDEGGGAVLYAVDAVTHYLAAGDHAAAWAVVERWLSALAAAGTEHLLMAPLEQLRDALPERRVDIDLLTARCLVRASLIEQADQVLSDMVGQRSAAQHARYCALKGEIAQRRGALSEAEALLSEAIAEAPDEQARFGPRTQIAAVAMIAGDGERARQILDAALAAVPEPTPRQRGSYGWARTVSWMFDERHEAAANEARRTRDALAGTGLADLTNRLAMLETLACIECQDMTRARAVAHLIDDAGLRRRVASLYRAIVSYADGDARHASAALARAHDELRSQGDAINAYIAAYYGSSALAEIGSVGDAQALAQRALEVAEGAGLRGAVGQAQAQRALLAAEALQLGLAHRLADDALACERIGPASVATAHCAHARVYTIEGDITRALDHIACARAAVTGEEFSAAQAAIDVEHSAIGLIGGNLGQAVQYAERAVAHYRDQSRDYKTSHAQLVLAAAYIARGRRTDEILGEKNAAQARELAERGEFRALRVGCAILFAALAQRKSRNPAARDLLANALIEIDPERGSLYAETLLAAIDGAGVAFAVPGAVALLAHLGFREVVDRYLVDQHGRRAATETDVARERSARALFVDEVGSVIIARGGEVEITGRPMQCALLSALVQARGETVTPDALYKRVWGGAEYHPLQHRNALYVAINRLRNMLRDAVPDQEVIERAPHGWRIAADVDACVAVAVREETR